MYFLVLEASIETNNHEATNHHIGNKGKRMTLMVLVTSLITLFGHIYPSRCRLLYFRLVCWILATIITILSLSICFCSFRIRIIFLCFIFSIQILKSHFWNYFTLNRIALRRDLFVSCRLDDFFLLLYVQSLLGCLCT